MIVLASATLRAGEDGLRRQPIHIGVQACSQCHGSVARGDQFSLWRLSAHSRAYAALAKPEAKLIAELSGVPEEPTKAKMCLECHATAADSEEWERAPGFHVQDGVQCEKCHAPGSEYAVEEMMKDREKAKAHGLTIPDKEWCLMCHRPKGSHLAVLNPKPFNLEDAWKTIAHPLVKGQEVEEPPRGEKSPGALKFTGVMACARCHQGPAMGHQFEKWRNSPHARSYAVLATDRGRELAKKASLPGEPQHSFECLKCHAPEATYAPASLSEGVDYRDGVTCEGCHGLGSEYSPEAIMRDRSAVRAAGLREMDKLVCLPCHEEAHGQPFNYAEAVRVLRHPTKLRQVARNAPGAQRSLYKNPLNLALTPNGGELWVTCEAAHSVSVVDTVARAKVGEIPVGGQPMDVAFDPKGRHAFVSNRLDDTVSVIDVKERKVIATLEVGDEPHGLLVDKEGQHLYVLNTSSDSISVFDLKTFLPVKQLTASRSPWSLALSPDGRRILVTSALPRFVPPRTSARSEVTVIDTERAVVEDRVVVPDANLLQGVAWHPSGQYALITLLRTKNLVPMTRVQRGWVISNGLGIIWADGTVDQVLLDHPDLCFPDPADVMVTPDGRYGLVTSSSTGHIAVVDLAKLVGLLKASSEHERRRVLPNHLGKPAEFVVTFIETKESPRGLVCSADGKRAYVAQTLDDSVGVIDLDSLAMVDRIDLGGLQEITKARRGEKLFNSANITFHRQFSCHSCHPDGHIDGITYDIESDGIGISPVDNRTLRGINDMAPYKWEGTNPSLKRQCGARLAVFFTRLQPFTPEELDAVDHYVCTIPRPPNRYRKVGAELSEAQRRGKALFERRYTNDGRLIPAQRLCVTCHPPPLYTDTQLHDVGTKGTLDRQGKFDAPHLNNIYDSAPYLHDGRSPTLEEIWTRFNPYDEHGVTNDLTKDQLNELIEYLKTL